jgi:hypothetical protein
MSFLFYGVSNMSQVKAVREIIESDKFKTFFKKEMDFSLNHLITAFQFLDSDESLIGLTIKEVYETWNRDRPHFGNEDGYHRFENNYCVYCFKPYSITKEETALMIKRLEISK